MKKIVTALLMMLFTSVIAQAQGQSPEPVEGQDYIEIPNGTPLDPADGKIVVEEFFNYICPACNSFEPQFSAWAKRLPDDVKVVPIPATFRPDFVPYAKAYYAAKHFGIAEKAHDAVYKAIHRAHTLPSEGQRPDAEKVAAFYAKYGVDADEFLAMMRSFQVDFKIRRADDHMKRSQVSGTPSIVINGRYLVRGRGFADILRTASYLIDKERGG
jgi:thiol:disulfide interchange protein DsbA